MHLELNTLSANKIIDFMVSLDEFLKLDLRVGKIISVEDHEGTRKPMYKITVDLGSEVGQRNIVAGIKGVYAKEELIGKLIICVTNLDPKEIAGYVSNGMMLAAEDNGVISILTGR